MSVKGKTLLRKLWTVNSLDLMYVTPRPFLALGLETGPFSNRHSPIQSRHTLYVIADAFSPFTEWMPS